MGTYQQGKITEYDIKACNANVGLASGLISDKFRDELLTANKKTRQVKFGLFLKEDKKRNDIYADAIQHYVDEFKKANGIVEDDIVSHVKDALWIKNKSASNRVFDDIVEFIPKQTYTSWYFHKPHIVFYYNSLTGAFLCRGLNEIPETKLFFDLVKEVMRYTENGKNPYRLIHEFIVQYSSDKYETTKIISDVYTKKEPDKRINMDNNFKLLNDLVDTFIK